jgi:RNA polymerase sigma factor (TIGR02999 family)
VRRRTDRQEYVPRTVRVLQGYCPSAKRRFSPFVACHAKSFMSHVTLILNAIERGETRSEELFALVYDELRRLASGQMRQERPGHTLQATALVHEVFLRLMSDSERTWQNRRHFFGAAAEAMRRILVEQARRKASIKRGGEMQRVDMPDIQIAEAPAHRHDIASLNEALIEFEKADPEKAELVKLRYFAGLQEAEAAQVLDISRATAARWWAYAKAWLYQRVQDEGNTHTCD